VSVPKAKATAEMVTVVVVAPFQTSHAGVVYGPKEVASVPDAVAAGWVLNGWAEAAD
jgi:hypothetical protein